MSSLLYLLQVNIYLALFYGFYVLLLRNETFFKLNRIYLVGGGFLSFLIPLMQSEWVKSLFITQKVQQVSQTVTYEMISFTVINPDNIGITAAEFCLSIYLAGASVFLLRFIWQLSRVRKALNHSGSKQAFSFFNKITVDPTLYGKETILSHERVHARYWHSADILFFELIGIISWFNPIVYLYKKAIKYIHEFTADEIAAGHENSKSDYALLLLSNNFGIQAHQFTNSFFNHSLLKRRIIMLSKSRSTRTALLKYGLSAPLFAVMLVFSSATIKPEKIENYAESLSHSQSDQFPVIIQLRSAIQDTIPLYIVDGIEIPSEEFTQINPKQIKALHVLKGEKAMAKYGQKGQNGVMEAYINSSAPVQPAGAKQITIQGSGTQNSTFKSGQGNTSGSGTYSTKDSKTSLAGFKGLVVIDGIPIENNLLKTIDPNTIESMNVLKGEAAIKKYGDKGKEGVIEIASKKK